jgi:S1-C subfamily serine protease
MYETGRGVPQNYQNAIGWYRKAAEQGLASAQNSLGDMYYNGRGVPQDYMRAYMWFNLAASSSNADDKKSAEDRDIVSRKMIPAQIALAQAMAQRCKSSKYQDCGFDATQVAGINSGGSAPAKSQPKAISSGTGFFVGESGHIVTNAHAVDGCDLVRSSRGGKLRQIAVDRSSDLALYISSEKSETAARIRGGRGARLGESVVAVGFPLGGLLSSNPVVTTGTISALSGMEDDRRQIQMTAPVQPGNSGGPLLGENGSVVGVIVGKLDALKVAKITGDIPQNVNFAVSVGTLQSFLNANGVAYMLDEGGGAISPADIAADASRYTVLLECSK